MLFQKGHKINLGKHHSDITKMKISLANKGKKSLWGYKHSKKTRKNMSLAHGGNGILDRFPKTRRKGGGNPPKTQRNDAIKEARKQKKTYRTIAKIFNLNVKTVYQIINRKKYKNNKKRERTAIVEGTKYKGDD